MTKRYSIRELAEEFDITTRALRFYEEKGLLTPTRSKQTRTYSAADRTRLRLILRGKRLGLTLEESSDIIRMYDPAAGNYQQMQTLIKKIREKRDQLLEQQKDLELMLIDLGAAEARCQQALDDSPKQRKA
jgi:DNA-binding transcriptional MerR regulator